MCSSEKHMIEVRVGLADKDAKLVKIHDLFCYNLTDNTLQLHKAKTVNISETLEKEYSQIKELFVNYTVIQNPPEVSSISFDDAMKFASECIQDHDSALKAMQKVFQRHSKHECIQEMTKLIQQVEAGEMVDFKIMGEIIQELRWRSRFC